MRVSCAISYVENMEFLHFYLWNFYFAYEIRNAFTYKKPNSVVRWLGSEFHMWNAGRRNMYILHLKIKFTSEILSSHVKWHVKYLYEIRLQTVLWLPFQICRKYSKVFKSFSQTTAVNFLQIHYEEPQNLPIRYVCCVTDASLLHAKLLQYLNGPLVTITFYGLASCSYEVLRFWDKIPLIGQNFFKKCDGAFVVGK